MNRVEPPQPWWTTIYVESKHVPPSEPTKYGEALGNLAWQLANNLITVLPANFGYRPNVPIKPYIGYGMATHELEVGWPRVIPRVVVESPHELFTSYTHYRHDPRLFDYESKWASPRLVANRISGTVDKFRRRLNGRNVHSVTLIDDIEDFCKPVRPSSFRLGQVAAGLSNLYVALECQRLELPEDCWPKVSLQGLRVERFKRGRRGVRAEPCEASL